MGQSIEIAVKNRIIDHGRGGGVLPRYTFLIWEATPLFASLSHSFKSKMLFVGLHKVFMTIPKCMIYWA